MEDSKNFIDDMLAEDERYYLAFDIETESAEMNSTVENYFMESKKDSRLKDPEKIEANKEKIRETFGLSPQTGKIILFGAISNKLIPNVPYREEDDKYYYAFTGEEWHILDSIWNLFYEAYKKNALLVSYNGKSFDIPFIFIRTLVHGLNSKTSYSFRQLTNLYSTDQHFDLYHNFFKEGKLATWSYLFGLSKSIYPENVNIPKWLAEGDFQKVLEKNYDDIKQVAEMYEYIERIV